MQTLWFSYPYLDFACFSLDKHDKKQPIPDPMCPCKSSMTKAYSVWRCLSISTHQHPPPPPPPGTTLSNVLLWFVHDIYNIWKLKIKPQFAAFIMNFNIKSYTNQCKCDDPTLVPVFAGYIESHFYSLPFGQTEADIYLPRHHFN